MSKPAIESISFGSNYKNGGMNGQLVRTPRPLPQFFQQQQTFSTKKEKAGTPKDALPPRPPIKSAPPISRIFPHKVVQKAQPVSFKAPHSSTPSIISPHYNEGSKELYFDQCFEIECKLGAGSFGEVFKVRSKEDGKLYAIKRSRERFRGESDRRRKLEEVNKHEKLRRHPNCVRFYKAWEEKQHLYIQTELCDTSLNNFADANHNIPERLIKNYMVDLLMAVKHLHDNDLVHMDIKPENIFISSNTDVCKLGDFGLMIDLYKDGAVVDFSEAQEGDPRYLAPEILRGQYGKPADIYSLGITLLEIASDLDLPKGGALWHQLREGSLPSNVSYNLAPELKQIVASMMEVDPRKRPTANKLLQHPVIKQIWRQRRREQAFRSLVNICTSVLQAIWCLLCTLWLTLTHPLHGLLPREMTTPCKQDISSHPPDWDHSFSDDEVLGDDSININNSLCAPLDFSTSSEDSTRDQDGFIIPSLPMRKGYTTPALRHKSTLFGDEPRSPLSTSSKSFYSSSPVCGHRVSLSLKSSDSFTPNSSYHRSLLEDLEHQRADVVDSKNGNGIAPKNLMDAFDDASSEDDCII